MDHVARVIHELDSAGNVVRIGWEPAGSVIERESAIKAVVKLMTCVAEALAVIHDHKSDPKELLIMREFIALVDAMADLRALMPSMQRNLTHGMSLPAWHLSRESKRHPRSAA